MNADSIPGRSEWTMVARWNSVLETCYISSNATFDLTKVGGSTGKTIENSCEVDSGHYTNHSESYVEVLSAEKSIELC